MDGEKRRRGKKCPFSHFRLVSFSLFPSPRTSKFFNTDAHMRLVLAIAVVHPLNLLSSSRLRTLNIQSFRDTVCPDKKASMRKSFPREFDALRMIHEAITEIFAALSLCFLPILNSIVLY